MILPFFSFILCLYFSLFFSISSYKSGLYLSNSFFASRFFFTTSPRSRHFHVVQKRREKNRIVDYEFELWNENNPLCVFIFAHSRPGRRNVVFEVRNDRVLSKGKQGKRQNRKIKEERERKERREKYIDCKCRALWNPICTIGRYFRAERTWWYRETDSYFSRYKHIDNLSLRSLISIG